MLSNPPPSSFSDIFLITLPLALPCFSYKWILHCCLLIVLCCLFCLCVTCFFFDKFHFRPLYDKICGPVKWYVCMYVCMPVLGAVIKVNIDHIWRQETSLLLNHICWYSHYTYKSTWSLFYLTTVVCHILLPFCYIYIYMCWWGGGGVLLGGLGWW